MYQFKESIIANQMSLLMEYGQSYALFKVVSEYISENDDDLEFWVHLNNVSVNDLVIKWCKVFGTDDNELHWKKASESEGFEEYVRSIILNVYEGSFESWRLYREEMCHFRNTYSAHRNKDEYNTVPLLGVGVEVAASYFDFLVDQLGPWSGYQPYLLEYVDNHKERILKRLGV